MLFDKSHKEYKRRLKAGATRFFCSLSCSRKQANIDNPPAHLKFYNTPDKLKKAQLATQYWKYTKIEAWLIKNNIEFEFEYFFFGDKKVRVFDLALPTFKTIIEFDGPEHFQNDAVINRRDRQKEKYVKKRGWQIYRVPVKRNSVMQVRPVKQICKLLTA